MYNKQLVVIVIPTYNEVENIKKLIPIFYREVFPLITDWTVKMVIVDAHSPDGTSQIVEDYAKIYEGLHLIKEENKSGIGSAYLQGFDYAMKHLSADVVIEFDADFQHPPQSIHLLLNKINDGFDYVLGSRTIEGGSEPAGRNIFRTILTEFGGLVAKFILFFPSKYFTAVTDPTTGLKATRVRGCLDKLDLNTDHLYSKKFGYKLQLLYETIMTGARYAEVPLNFGNRASGSSKFEAGTAWDILVTCLKTRMRSARSEKYLIKTKI